MVFFELVLFYNFSISLKSFLKKHTQQYNNGLKRKGEYVEKMNVFFNYLGVDFLPFGCLWQMNI